MESGKKRLALLVGCNYPNTEYELHGCVNDVVGMRETLVSRFGFDRSQIELLTDSSNVKPTGANIKKALGDMVDKAESGDVLYFHYSGHGTRIPSVKPHNPFGMDEAIVPCDFNLITDVDFRHLVNRLPEGASFTFLSDSCHSGGLIEKEKEQIGPTSARGGGGLPASSSSSVTTSRPKSIPLESIAHHLSALTKIDSPEAGPHMLELFGPDSSLRFRPHLEDYESRYDGGILLSGCQANESSQDLNPIEAGGKARGAFTDAVQKVLNDNPRSLTNRELVLMSRTVLVRESGYLTQHPCLYCTDANADAVFLWQH